MSTEENGFTDRFSDLISRVETAVYRESISISPLRFWSGQLDDTEGMRIEAGFGYQATESAAWIAANVTIPERWAGERVGLHIEISGGEPLLFVDGTPFQGLDLNHSDVLLSAEAEGGAKYALSIELCASVGAGGQARANVVNVVRIARADLVLIDRTMWRYWHDLRAARELLYSPMDPAERKRMMQAIDDAGDRATGSRQFDLSSFLGDPEAPGLTCVGHSHLDLAYLWPMRITHKKVGRTWATTLNLLDEYPEFHFTQSQPFLYRAVQQDYPDLWRRLKSHVADRRWELTGAMWVEPDANVPSGEALIRQVLYGQSFYEKEFGERSAIAWLPDTFGFPGSLPQILAGCGIRYLLTSKLSWNDTNTFPNDTFRWTGIDGRSDILVHCLTTPHYHAGLESYIASYNGDATAEQIIGAWTRYSQEEANPEEIMHCLGFGDGGGGTTRGMIELVRRFADAPGMPRCSFDRSDAFFDRLNTKRTAFPAWRGELYLENHRGTLTSQGWIKRANRRCETLLRNAELFSVLAEVEAGIVYPADELRSVWEMLLTNQFHDILAGTVIPEAVNDAKRDMAQVEASATKLLNVALDAIAERIVVKEDTVVVFNPTDTLRPADIVRVTVPANVVKAVEFADERDALLPSQFLGVSKKGERDYLVLLNEVGPLGYQTIVAHKASGPQEQSTVWAELVEGTGATLENEFARVILDERGEIVSFQHKIYDDEAETDAVTNREIIADGERGNRLAVYEDKPSAYDAWNIDAIALSKPTFLAEIATVERFAVIENGPVRAGVEITYRFRASSITQRIYLQAQSPRLNFETVVDWHEHQTLLCALFPVAVNADRATYEIQHGSIERSTHENTSWDAARFEVCHHRWMDLSEGDYGVSLLNDCKYGGGVRDNVLRLTLIKSGIYPDPNADQGEHRFTYALLPHTGDFRSETVDEAHALNYPLLSRFVRKADKRVKPALPKSYALASVNDQGLVIDAFKKAEDGDGYIVRLYDAFNTRGKATLTIGFDTDDASAVDLMEEQPKPLEVTGGGDIAFSFATHEIKTFRIRPAAR